MRLSSKPFVVSDVERLGPTEVRVVVDDADRMMSDIGAAVEELGTRVVEMDEHIVDYDEAFVRVVERHRGATTGGGEEEETS